jgi:hypothetical protein
MRQYQGTGQPISLASADPLTMITLPDLPYGNAISDSFMSDALFLFLPNSARHISLKVFEPNSGSAQKEEDTHVQPFNATHARIMEHWKQKAPKEQLPDGNILVNRFHHEYNVVFKAHNYTGSNLLRITAWGFEHRFVFWSRIGLHLDGLESCHFIVNMASRGPFSGLCSITLKIPDDLDNSRGRPQQHY